MKDEHVMARGSLMRIEDGRGLLLYVREGALWLTQERDGRDRYLGAGDWFRLDRDGVAIAQAMRHSTIELYPAAKPRAMTSATREESHATESAAS